MERSAPEPLGRNIEDLPEEAKKLFMDMVDHLVMDSDFSATLANLFPKITVEEKKKCVLELINAGYIKAQLNEDWTGYRWLVWEDGEYRPFC